MQDFDIIETPENVELHRPLAGIGSRLTAGLIDNLIIFGFFFVIFLILAFTGLIINFGWETVAEAIISALFILMIFIVYWGYFFFCEMYTNGQSPGKRIVKIRVVQEEGQGITFTSIAIRNLLRVVDGLGLYSVAGISMFFTGKIQRLGDLAAGTIVVSEQTIEYSGQSDKKRTVKVTEEHAANVSETAGLTREEYRILHQYWVRRNELSVEARLRILPRLIKPVLDKRGESMDGKHLEDLEIRLDEIINQSLSSLPNQNISTPDSSLPKDTE